MATEEKYVCTLDKASLARAENELKEIPSEREGAVESFRQWILQNNKWLKSPTDTKFLLAFLRNAKFIQLAARKRLVNYWTVRSEIPEWFANLDTTDPKFVECLRVGFFAMPPNRDTGGRTLLLGRMGYMDTVNYTVDDYMRISVAVMDYFLMDEHFQVNGTHIMEDMTKVSLKHETFFGVQCLKKMMKVWIKAFPIRYKSLHYFNTNPIFEAMFVIIGPLLPEKLKNRMTIHGSNLTDVYKCIEKSLFPREYLPDDYNGKCPGTVEEIIENTIKELQKPEIRDAILELSSAKYRVDKNLKPDDTELFTESFRQLHVD